MKKKFLVSLCAILFLTVGCSKSPKLSNGEEVIASVDGKEFTVKELYDSMKDQYGTSILVNMIDSYIAEKEIGETDDAKVYADSTISQYKVQYEQYGMDFKEALASAGYASEDAFKKVIMSDYMKNEVTSKYVKETITDKEIEKYYNDNISEELNVKHILIAPDAKKDATDEEKTKAEEAAYTKALDLINQLNNGADFEKLAKENSSDTGSASNGGVINNVTKSGYVTEFYNAAYNLKDGEYTTTPVKSEYGYHIIYKVSTVAKKSLEESKESILDELSKSKISADSTLEVKTWDSVRTKYNMNIVDTNIKTNYSANISNASNAKNNDSAAK